MVDKKQLKIVHLYPSEMNIYGDTGNVLVLSRRLEWRGIGVDIARVGLKDEIPSDADIIVSGGGQDAGQMNVQKDLLDKADSIKELAKNGTVMLVICGTYQLFGKRFLTKSGKEILGIGLFDMDTRAGDNRLIGNVVTESEFGTLVGYENHSGRTFLAEGLKPLGRVVRGEGNNDEDDSEGAIFMNVFGTYLHGPILPKNPVFADELLRRALNNKYGTAEIDSLDDEFSRKAAEIAATRPR